jgi:hypothetical protein
LSREQTGVEGARALAKLLAQSKLQHLILSDDQSDKKYYSWISSFMGIMADGLADGLNGSQHLKELNHADNLLDHEDLGHLTKILCGAVQDSNI